MLSIRKHLKLWKVLFLCTLMAVLIGVPITTISAKTTNAQRGWLKKTLDYCAKLDKSDYTTASWTALQKEIKEANAVYKLTSKTDKEYSSARDELEVAKSNLQFITSTKKKSPLPYRQLTVNEIVKEMGAGWNLGNTLDGHTGFVPSETIWQSTVTTKAFIKAVHDSGFNTVRIPVTWGTKIDDDNNYTIDENWISRVEDIVDYCIAQDMYVIINLHHDGAEQAGWIRVASDDIDPVYEKFEHVWRNIAERFKNYDEHLIFESMNEVTGGGHKSEEHDIQVIMNLNQIFVNVVRSTGSNNSERWLSVPGRYTNIDTSTDPKLGFDLPKDIVKNRLFVSVHHYDFFFGLLDNMTKTKWSTEENNTLSNLLNKVVVRFTSKGIPVILGEYGALNKNNTKDRALQYEAFARINQFDGVVGCVWDTGDYNFKKKPDYSYSLFDRKTGEKLYPTLTDAIMRGTYLPGKADLSDIVMNVKVKKITEITLSDTSLSMIIGDSKKVTTEVKPSDANDVILWKTSDPTIATVSNGYVRARGIGTTTIKAFTQSGSLEKVITVVVNKKSSKNPCTAIVAKDSYEIAKGKNIKLEVSLQPSNTDDYVTYKSSDEAIATVSTLGKVVGCSAGTTYITITASNGLTKVVKINVTEGDNSKELSVALNVYFNDSKNAYYANETGKSIKITGDGQYTVVFDIAQDLSKKGKSSGVTSLTDLTAIYIKDYNVTLGKTSKSPITACNIMYDKIVVDGKELTITQKAPKSAIKSSGVLDTNDPFNSWEGSSVKEVKVSNHILNIDGFVNPKRVEVTFTISGLKFQGENSTTQKVVKTIPVESINASSTEAVVLNNIGDTIEVTALVTPVNATSGVAFVSSNSSIVAVDTNAVSVDPKTGKATIKLTAMSNGTVTITAYTNEGFKTTFQVTVGK